MITEYIENSLYERFPSLCECKNEIEAVVLMMLDTYKRGGKILLCGNGGSCADCEHIVGELMKGFLSLRALSDDKKAKMMEICPEVSDMLDKLQDGLPAISLTSFTGLNTAFCNDVDADLVFAQSLLALGRENDVLIALSTSGNSKNVVNAVKIAKSLGIKVISLTGEGGGKLAELSDICIKSPEKETYKVQELHLPIYHYLCAEVEKYFF